MWVVFVPDSQGEPWLIGFFASEHCTLLNKLRLLNNIFSSRPVVALHRGFTEGEDEPHRDQEILYFYLIG